MGANNKNNHDHQRTFINTSPSNNNKKSGSQRPSPSKSISIKTPNKGCGGHSRNNYYNNNNNNNYNSARLSLSGSPTSSFFAGSKCFESPSPDSLPQPPKNWMMTISNKSTSTNSSTTNPQVNRVRKALILPMENNDKSSMHKNSCAMEYATAFSTHDMMTNDHFTQSLKLLLNVNA